MEAIEAKVRENRLRRMARRQGLHVKKWRLRDPRAINYGRYMLVNTYYNMIIPGYESASLDDIEDYLTRDR